MHKGVQQFHFLLTQIWYLVNITCAALRVDNSSSYRDSSAPRADSGENLTIGANDPFATSNSPAFPCPI